MDKKFPLRIRTLIQEHLIQEVHVEATRSSGAGGQNINKTNTKAQMTWEIEESPLLSIEQKERFRTKYAHHINKDGRVFHAHQTERSLYLNIKAGYEYLQSLIESIWFAPKKRVATKPTKSSQRERVEGKRLRSDVKKQRQKIKI